MFLWRHVDVSSEAFAMYVWTTRLRLLRGSSTAAGTQGLTGTLR